jgi:hypothetical protein
MDLVQLNRALDAIGRNAQPEWPVKPSENGPSYHETFSALNSAIWATCAYARLDAHSRAGMPLEKQTSGDLAGALSAPIGVAESYLGYDCFAEARLEFERSLVSVGRLHESGVVRDGYDQALLAETLGDLRLALDVQGADEAFADARTRYQDVGAKGGEIEYQIAMGWSVGQRLLYPEMDDGLCDPYSPPDPRLEWKLGRAAACSGARLELMREGLRDEHSGPWRFRRARRSLLWPSAPSLWDAFAAFDTPAQDPVGLETRGLFRVALGLRLGFPALAMEPQWWRGLHQAAESAAAVMLGVLDLRDAGDEEIASLELRRLDLALGGLLERVNGEWNYSAATPSELYGDVAMLAGDAEQAVSRYEIAIERYLLVKRFGHFAFGELSVLDRLAGAAGLCEVSADDRSYEEWPLLRARRKLERAHLR